MSGTALVKYDEAVRAVAACVRFDEAKEWQDRAAAYQAYARQAQDKRLEVYYTEIRMRAQRRAGEILIELKERGERRARGTTEGCVKVGGRKARGNPGSTIDHDDRKMKLADLGVNDNQATRWQNLARLPAKDFEEKVAVATGKKPKPKPAKAKKPKRRNIAEEMSQVEIDDANDVPTEDRPENIATAFHLRMDQGIVFCKEAMTLADEMLVKLPKRKKEFADTARALLSECQKLLARLED